jgi:antibiotic biosynthesis monooxygenase (ABM) superfamily enzyme
MVHVAITRRVRPGCEAEFQRALLEFFQRSLAHDGVHGVHMLAPPPESKLREFGILRTFASDAERKAFYGSPLFAAWEARVAPLVEGEASYRDLSGLEAWFRSDLPLPPRWKMAVATLAGVYPTSLLLSVTVGETVHAWPLLLRGLVFAVCMVTLLTWVVMPVVTRGLRPWLHARDKERSI